jgi:hypothetical protein
MLLTTYTTAIARAAMTITAAMAHVRFLVAAALALSARGGRDTGGRDSG